MTVSLIQRSCVQKWVSQRGSSASGSSYFLPVSSVPWTFGEVVMIVYQGRAPTDAHSLYFDQCSVIALTSTHREAERFSDEDLGHAGTAV